MTNNIIDDVVLKFGSFGMKLMDEYMKFDVNRVKMS